MIRTKLTKAVFLMATVMISLAACRDKSSLLLRTWKLKDLKYTREIPEGLRPAIDKYTAEMKKSMTITYNSDGTYATKNNDQVLHGKWKLNWNSSIITSVTDNGETKDFGIVELSHDSFTFKAEERGQEVIFVMVPAN